MREPLTATTPPIVSVVTPLYNHARYLNDYVEGLLSQTYPPIELIVVDDCSTDDSWERLDGWKSQLERRFKRIQIFRNDSNRGLLRTLSRALEHVRGELTCILESDDYFYPTKVEANVERLAADVRVGLLHSDVDFLHESTGRFENAHWKSKGRNIPQGYVYEDLLGENHILTCTTCIRTKALLETVDIDRYEAAGYSTADYPLFLDLAKRYEVAYIDKPLACYRVVDESISHPKTLERQLEWKLAYYRVKIDQLETADVSDAVEQRARAQYERTRFRLGWVRGDADQVESASRELERIGQGRLAGTDRARRQLVRSRWGWRLGLCLERMLRARRELTS